MSEPSLVAYRWSDGMFVSFELCDHGQILFEVQGRGPEAETMFLWLDPSVPSVETVQHQGFSRPFERKVMGFLLDLGAKRPYSGSPEILGHHSDGVSAYPLFVPDEVWGRRYNDALALFESDTRGHFLLWDNVEVFQSSHNGEPTRLSLEFFLNDEKRDVAYSGPTVEDVVDSLVEGLLVLPVSRRAAWEEANVEVGTWVTPSPEEIELYRVVGEELPFWWSSEKFETWFRERAP